MDSDEDDDERLRDDDDDDDDDDDGDDRALDFRRLDAGGLSCPMISNLP